MAKRETKRNAKIGTGIVLFSLVVLFLVSFCIASWILIKSNNLVFADSIKEYEEKVKTAYENEEKIKELEEQVERYKKLYDSVVAENKVLSAELSKSTFFPLKDEKTKEEPDFSSEAINSRKSDNS